MAVVPSLIAYHTFFVREHNRIANAYTLMYQCMCYLGDFRVAVVPSLIAYHTVFVREYNRIARAISRVAQWYSA